jgi:hypothetical protein
MTPIDFDGNVVVGDATSGASADRALREAGSRTDGEDRDEGPGDQDGGALDGEIGRDADSGETDLACPTTATATLSAAEAIAQADAFDHRVVAVTGTSTATDTVCSHQPCADGGACCNTCSATVAIDGVLPLRGSACFPAPGCSGNECSQVCRPPIIGVRQTFRGELLRDDGGVGLRLFSVGP